MVLWIDKKYTGIISTRLDKYSQKNKDGLFAGNFRCVYCGDSSTNKSKKRGWLYEKNGAMYYKCFNCGMATTFGAFLKNFDPLAHKEYTMELFKEKMDASPAVEYDHDITKFQKKRIDKFDPFDGIKKISQLPIDHPAKIYITNRKVPSFQHYRIYYIDKFYEWVNNRFIEDKFDKDTLKYDEPRIVFPFIDPHGYVYGVNARSLNPKSTLRYISLMLDDDKPKFFGWDIFDNTKENFIVEGPMDSLFLPNCGAMAGADAQLNLIGNRLSTIIIFDNEPRNKEIVSRMAKYIHEGWKVCIWPSHIKEKDINDMILSGMTTDGLYDIVVSNSHSGLSAQIKFNQWSKI